jgi:hypothetical protein
MENKKIGIYKQTNILIDKRYINFLINLFNKLKSYYNILYFDRKIKTNNSIICKMLLKYGYFNPRLDIIEFIYFNYLTEK